MRSKLPGAYLCLIFTPLLAGLLYFGAQNSLQKGQVIKQFFAYSITQSLGREPSLIDRVTPDRWLKTKITDCEPPRYWVEEPPLFHLLSSLFPQTIQAVSVSLLSYLLILFCAWVWLKRLMPAHTFNQRCFLIAIFALSPGFLRYSVQHIPP
jgi:hypothetical protein